MTVADLFLKSLMITSFVSVMMLLVEYLNVQTRGVLLRGLHGSRWRQYVLAAALGAVPGCLGAFAAVALYTHRRITLGALVGTMIATSGDETYVMLALFPRTALLMTLALAVIGVGAAWATDTLLPVRWMPPIRECSGLEIHDEAQCRCLPRGEILAHWRPPSPYRATMVAALALFGFVIVTGQLGTIRTWIRLTLLVVTGAGMFVASTVPEHFLEEHLWRHVVVKHVPRIFGWTFGVLITLAALNHLVNLSTVVSANLWQTLVVAAALGVLPESGPHLAFVTMFADGNISFSILLASSIVQDGHGMLPVLSASKRAFVVVKALNLIVGLLIGGALLALGV
jgi:hypothetical protein